ncbi:DNA replication and repair protein RecF [Chitinophagales bacterium]|nr:DNA replication and repair protein RecF [Chitinophagales bacterium]
MFIRKLHITNYKNHEKKVFSFNEDTCAFIGLNGVGKTNILDAIYMLCIGKSFFSSSDKNCIKQGESFFRLQIYMDQSEHKELIITAESSKRKKIVLDGIQHVKNANHLGIFPVVVVSPNDHVLITGSAEERRKFIDQTLSQLSRDYLNALLQYNASLKQRNALLKQAEEKGLDKNLLSIYNDSLHKNGVFIYQSRHRFFENIKSFFKESFIALSAKDEGFTLSYTSHLAEKSLSQLLDETLKKDIILRRTTKGIHRDDVKFEMSGESLKDFGSQGQQKTVLLALKLAQFNFLKAQLNKVPLFIIDDIFDKLDMKRSQNLMNFLINQQGQVFISHTDKDMFQNISSAPVQVIDIE